MDSLYVTKAKIGIINEIIKQSDGVITSYAHAHDVYIYYCRFLGKAGERNVMNHKFNLQEEAEQLYANDRNQFPFIENALNYVYARDAIIIDRINPISISRDGDFNNGGVLVKNTEMYFKTVRKLKHSFAAGDSLKSDEIVFEDNNEDEEELPNIDDLY